MAAGVAGSRRRIRLSRTIGAGASPPDSGPRSAMSRIGERTLRIRGESPWPRCTEPIVGIDLGTTYSVVAALDPSGRPVTITNRHGDLSTPSVVLLDDDELIVGKEAPAPGARRARTGGRVSQAGHGGPVLPSAGRRPAGAARGDLGDHPQAAQGRRRTPGRPDQARGHHRAGLLRPHPPRGDLRGRPAGRARGRRPPQRADRRGPGLRVPGRASSISPGRSTAARRSARA